jgi:thiamine pyrophosphokinase
MPLSVTILADGDPCPKKLRQALCKDRFVLLLDGAAEAARREGWKPDMISGDFDAIRPATMRHFAKNGVGLLHTPDQNHTDLEKAIAWCLHHKAESVWVAQALGGRVDHTFANLGLLKRFHGAFMDLRIWREGESVRYVRDAKLRLHGPAGRHFAVLPFPTCKASSRGLAFELDGSAMALGVRESVANKAGRKNVHLEIRGSALVVEGMESKQ